MLARLTIGRHLPRLVGARYYAVRSEGSVAQSKEFHKKEKGEEDRYVRAQEQAKLKKLHAQKEAEAAQLKQKQAEIEKEKAELEAKLSKE